MKLPLKRDGKQTTPRPEKPAREPRAKPQKAPREKRTFGLFRRRERRAVERPVAVLPQYSKSASPRLVVVLGIALALFCFVYGFGFGIFAPARMVQFFLPILVVGVLTVWALPEFGKAPTDTIERLFFIFFVSLPLWPNYLAIALPGLPWITVMRILGFPLVLLLLIAVSTSPEFRQRMGQPINAIPLLWKTLAAFTVLEALSVGWSDLPQLSLNKLLVALVNWTAIFFISAFVFMRKGRVERWAMVLWFMAVALSLIGVREFMEQKVLWAGHIPQFLAVEDESVQRVLTGRMRAGTDRYRVLTTFSTALGFGEFLAICTPFILHFMMGSYRLVIRIAAALSLPLILNAIVLTDTRLGMVGFLLSCMLYVFFWGALRWREVKGSILGPAIVIAYPAIAAAFGAAILLVPRLRVMTLGGGKHQASTEARVDQVNMGIPLLFTHPLGFGIGRGGERLGYANKGGSLTIDTYYLLVALDYGIIGFLLFYGIFVIAMIGAFRTIVSYRLNREQVMLVPLLIALFCYFVIKSIYAGVENQSTMFMMLGAVAALVYRVKAAASAPQALNARGEKPRRRVRATAIA